MYLTQIELPALALGLSTRFLHALAVVLTGNEGAAADSERARPENWSLISVRWTRNSKQYWGIRDESTEIPLEQSPGQIDFHLFLAESLFQSVRRFNPEIRCNSRSSPWCDAVTQCPIEHRLAVSMGGTGRGRAGGRNGIAMGTSVAWKWITE